MPAVKKTTTRPAPPPALLSTIVRALDGKKAGDLRVLEVAAQSSITDYLVLATGTSEPHLRALRVELEKAIDATAAPIAGMESSPGSGWLVVDAYQVMVHLFLEEQRGQYRLEQLWKDAIDVPVAGLLATAAPQKTKRKTTAAKATPVKRKAAAKKPATKKTARKKPKS
jgi:ribosome-associated protein